MYTHQVFKKRVADGLQLIAFSNTLHKTSCKEINRNYTAFITENVVIRYNTHNIFFIYSMVSLLPILGQ